jgi:hypothetical protein
LVALLLAARALFRWSPPFDPGWLVLAAFLLPAAVTGVRLLMARRARARE